MKPKIKEIPEMIIVGTVASGNTVGDIYIHELWGLFEKNKQSIKHKIEGKSYEVHICGEYSGTNKHYCIVGVEVKKTEDVPLDMFVKVIPAGKYAVFTHQFKNGSYGKAYETINDWLRQAEYEGSFPFDIQCYDKRFQGTSHPESEIEFYIPIKKKIKSERLS